VKIAERKLVELRDKLAGISDEFDRWLADAGERRPLRKHHSQITRLTQQLRGLVDRVGIDVVNAHHDGSGVLDDSRELQMRMLEVHRIWDFYRSKLNLRYVEWFRPYLGALDEFAWACSALADAHGRRPGGATTVKTAPLVFLSGEFSPFLHARQSSFDVEEVADAPNSLGFLQIISTLPVPVIGLPWYQLTHLADAVLVAHEIGHDVERDLAMTGTIGEHVRAVGHELPAQRRGGWFAWLPEVFADVYAVLAAGPAFVAALVDLLASDPAEPVGPPWRSHPPAPSGWRWRPRSSSRAASPRSPNGCPTRSGSPFPTPSSTSSPSSRSGRGSRPTTPSGSPATAPGSWRSPGCSTCPAGPRACE
jgi:hypothetical protein